MEPGDLERFLAEQQSQGRKDGTNLVFTLDAGKAAEKLSAYLIDPPALGGLKLLQGLIGAGPKTVLARLRDGRLTLRARLSEPPARLDVMDAFQSGLPRWRRDLCLGAWQLHNQDFRMTHEEGWTVLSAEVGEQAAIFQFRTDFSPVPVVWDPPWASERYPVRPRFSLSEDMPALEMFVAGAGLPVRDGPAVFHRLGEPRRPCRAVLRIFPDAPGPGVLRPVVSGVAIESVPVEWGVPGLRGWCCADGWKTDLAGLRLVRDGDWEKHLAHLRLMLRFGVQNLQVNLPPRQLRRSPVRRTLSAWERFRGVPPPDPSPEDDEPTLHDLVDGWVACLRFA